MDSVKDGFFLATAYTTRNDGCKAPEQVLEFDCRLVTSTPQNEPIAFGFARWGDEEYGTPTGFGTAEWEQFDWVLKDSAPHA